MNLPTIEQGEELLKKVSDAEWNWDANNPQHQLLAFLVNHASELLQMAREVERTREHCQQLMDEIDSLQHEVKRLEEILDKPY